MNRDMNAFRRPPTTPLGRVLHDIARHDVPDDSDLRDRVMNAIKRHEADRAPRDAAGRAWNLPALDPPRRRRRVTDSNEEHESTIVSSQPNLEPIPVERHRWLREGLKLAAAAIIFGIIGALLVLVLRNNDSGDHSSVPGAGPSEATATTLVSPTISATVVTQVSPTIDATVARQSTRQASQDAARQALTATADSATATQSALPSPGEVVATIELGESPGWFATTDGALWVGNTGEGTISRIDPTTNTVVATVTVAPRGGRGGDAVPNWLVSYDGQVWATDNPENKIVRVDPATNTVVQAITMVVANESDRPKPGGLIVDSTGVWASDIDGGRLVHFDAVTGAVLAEIPMDQPSSLGSGFGSIWVVAGQGAQTIVRVDPSTHTIVSEIPVTSNVWVFEILDDAVWGIGGDGDLFRIDPATNTLVATIDTGLPSSHASHVTPAGIWVGGYLHGGLVRIDPDTGAQSRNINDDHIVWDLIEFDGSIWAANGNANTVVRIDPAP
ncbi:MAG TPA: glutaminyl-peptide cyclotransferase [Thermomicrobiales bacterium]|nr:glutaminyl-peptide cyclotransferase [Thermomicrobiales bacterium]